MNNTQKISEKTTDLLCLEYNILALDSMKDKTFFGKICIGKSITKIREELNRRNINQEEILKILGINILNNS